MNNNVSAQNNKNADYSNMMRIIEKNYLIKGVKKLNGKYITN